MKKILLLLSVMSFSLVNAQVITQNLVAYWPFNGNANDNSGNGHNGTVQGATLTTDQWGNDNSAYQFYGSSYINVNDHSDLDITGALTICMWYKYDISTQTWGRLISKPVDGDTYNAYALALGDQSIAPKMYFEANLSPSAKSLIGSNEEFQDDRWYHLAGVFDPIKDSIYFYVNGVLMASEEANNSTLVQSDYNLRIGNDARTNQGIKGTIDEVYLFDRALDQSEIIKIRNNNQSLTDHIIGYWSFSGDANDESDNNNHGTVVGASLAYDRFNKSNSAFEFENVPDNNNQAINYVEIVDSPDLRIEDSLSICAWIKMDYNGSEPVNILGKAYGSGYYNSYCIWYWNTSVSFSIGGNSNSLFLYADYPQDNMWHFLSCIYNGDSAFIYIDNELISRDKFINPILYDNHPLYIGADDNNGDFLPDAGFTGLIDDVYLFDKALTPSEINSLYTEQNIVENETFANGSNECVHAIINLTIAENGQVEIQSGATIDITAGRSILFLPGFHAQIGSNVNAYISTEGVFCNTGGGLIANSFYKPAFKSASTYNKTPSNSLLIKKTYAFPNPTTGIIQINGLLENENTIVSIYNLTGQILDQIEVNSMESTINLSSYKKGTYYLSFNNNFKSAVKIIKK